MVAVVVQENTVYPKEWRRESTKGGGEKEERRREG
jgi:hypothetical protein